MKKQLISAIAVLACTATLVTGLSACTSGGSEVSRSEWEAAFNYDSFKNCTMVVESEYSMERPADDSLSTESGGTETITQQAVSTIKCDMTAKWLIETENTYNGQSSSNGQGGEYVDGKYYLYSKYGSNDWTSTETSETSYATSFYNYANIPLLAEFTETYDQFTFSGGTYVCEEFDFGGATAEVSITFNSDKKLASLEVEASVEYEEGLWMSEKMSFTITDYGSTEVTLPEVQSGGDDVGGDDVNNDDGGANSDNVDNGDGGANSDSNSGN